VIRNPYEPLYEATSVPLKAYVLDAIAERLADAVIHFPPTIDAWPRPELRERFEPLLTRVRPPIASKVWRCALKLYAWELERDVERIDAYLSGGHHGEFGLGPDELETAIFLWQHWWNETLAFKEYAKGKFTWRELPPLAGKLASRLEG